MSRKLFAFYVNLRRYIGLFLRNHRKHIKLIIDANEFNKFKNELDCIVAVQLSRMVNSIRSCQRSYLRAACRARFANEKDKVDLTFLHCALLYEGIITFNSLATELKKLNWWQSNISRIKNIQKQQSQKSSFWNSVLKPIRNKVFFHFDRSAIEKILAAIKPTKNIAFSTGLTNRNKDIVYTLSDDIALTLILSSIGPKGNTIEKFEWLETNLNNLSNEFCKICVSLITELIRGHVKLEKSYIK